MKRITIGLLALAGVAALVAVSAAGGAATKKGKPSLSATPVFKLSLKPSQEVPRIKKLRARAGGHVTFDLTRDTSGAITSGEVVFYFNYSFPDSVNITGLHIHQAAKGVNGPIVVDSGAGSFADTDGAGNVTTMVSGVSSALLQGILDNPRNYYVNLHTSVNPGGALRDQMHNPKKG
ncbi:MAG: CHRD domain-containing protein [Gaiellaceae bacterium]